MPKKQATPPFITTDETIGKWANTGFTNSKLSSKNSRSDGILRETRQRGNHRLRDPAHLERHVNHGRRARAGVARGPLVRRGTGHTPLGADLCVCWYLNRFPAGKTGGSTSLTRKLRWHTGLLAHALILAAYLWPNTRGNIQWGYWLLSDQMS